MRHILVIDPAVHRAETDSFNRLVAASKLPLTYHLPALFGVEGLATLPAEPSGIIILGSASSVHDQLPWQKPLNTWVKARIVSGVPTFGICYGHQMIASLFGGTVKYMSESKVKVRGFREVIVAPEPLWGGQKRGMLFASHCEIVPSCPPDMRVIARSDLVMIEGLAHDRFPTWTLQTHPEATPTMVAGLTGDNHFAAPRDLEFGWSLVKSFLNFVAESRKLPERMPYSLSVAK